MNWTEAQAYDYLIGFTEREVARRSEKTERYQIWGGQYRSLRHIYDTFLEGSTMPYRTFRSQAANNMENLESWLAIVTEDRQYWPL